jgi:multidrug efflux system outer membrane protein
MTSVLAQVARSYVDLRGAQARLSVAEHNVDVQRQTLELVDLLLREGAATELDVARARTQLLTSQATIPSLRAAERAARNRLTTLTGQAPGTLQDVLGARAPLPGMPETVAAGRPADLLRRRPDIRAAERALAASAARIGVATADLYPTISFGGRGGAGGTPLSALGAEGAPFFALGPSLRWNLFDREAVYARIRQQDSSAAAAMARFEATITRALEEVDTALGRWSDERERRARLEAARAASRDATRLAQLRYREGVEDFLTVLDAERRLLEVEDQLASSDVALAQNLVDIYLALGGGWQAAEAPAFRPYAPAD